jgi:hypothetical protein
MAEYKDGLIHDGLMPTVLAASLRAFEEVLAERISSLELFTGKAYVNKMLYLIV